jgi:hypothetical protein
MHKIDRMCQWLALVIYLFIFNLECINGFLGRKEYMAKGCMHKMSQSPQEPN